jgi:hypothetical protein
MVATWYVWLPQDFMVSNFRFLLQTNVTINLGLTRVGEGSDWLPQFEIQVRIVFIMTIEVRTRPRLQSPAESRLSFAWSGLGTHP